MRTIAIALLAVALSACACGPAGWAEETEHRLECGMSVEEVRRVVGRDVEKRDVPRDWYDGAWQCCRYSDYARL